ncbi:hypothetical protein Ciccas_002000 [Cichlidogyrus casuarinus]|uniref:Uncharacterized protein n=1 Tax=Cichlidogyrus casuarinus TaxID=1844966 RepID=A0ABD2QIH8_9PLAT
MVAIFSYSCGLLSGALYEARNQDLFLIDLYTEMVVYEQKIRAKLHEIGLSRCTQTDLIGAQAVAYINKQSNNYRAKIRQECGKNAAVILLQNCEQAQFLHLDNHHEEKKNLIQILRELMITPVKKVVEENSEYFVRPPAPELLASSRHRMCFRPKVWNQPVRYYSLFGRLVTGTRATVHANDFKLEETGIMQSADDLDECILTVANLTANQQYVFALVAYDQSGQRIGSMGESTGPITASPSINTLILACQMGKTCLQCDMLDEAGKIWLELWTKFIDQAPVNPKSATSVPFKLCHYTMKEDLINHTSSMTIHDFTTFTLQYLTKVGHKHNYGATLTNSGGLTNQINRLCHANLLLLCLKSALTLEEHALALDCVKLIYAALSPMIFEHSNCYAITELATECMNVLVECAKIRKNDHSSVPMVRAKIHPQLIASLGFCCARILKHYDEMDSASLAVEQTKFLLQNTSIAYFQSQKNKKVNQVSAPPTEEENQIAARSLSPAVSASDLTAAPLRPQSTCSITGGESRLFHAERELSNDDCKALEAFVQCLTLQKSTGLFAIISTQ